jgi:hypothetical protein
MSAETDLLDGQIRRVVCNHHELCYPHAQRLSILFKAADDVEMLKDENQRLRDELHSLKNRQDVYIPGLFG